MLNSEIARESLRDEIKPASGSNTSLGSVLEFGFGDNRQGQREVHYIIRDFKFPGPVADAAMCHLPADVRKVKSSNAGSKSSHTHATSERHAHTKAVFRGGTVSANISMSTYSASCAEAAAPPRSCTN